MEAIYSAASAALLFDPILRAYIFYGEDDRQKDEALTFLRARALDDSVREAGALIRFKALGDEQLVDWVIHEAQSAGKKITDEAAGMLVERAGDSRRVLSNELEKAICFAGDSDSITAQTLEAILS